MTDLAKLPSFDGAGHIRMVVESPRGAALKIKLDAKLKVFGVGRALPLGTSYPFDWGFVPGTKAEDGDPLDAMALHDAASYPGVVLACRALGVVDVTQKSKAGEQENPRLILIPTWNERLANLETPRDLPKRLKEEIEQFFVSATFFTGKDPRIKGWRGPREAEELVRSVAAKT